MNTETNAAVPAELPPSSLDQKKIISRLVIQKFLSSDASQYLDPAALSTLNTLFLSESPDRDMSINYRIPDRRDSYYGGVATVSLGWEPSKEELQDLDGNVWNTHTLKIVPSITSSYTSGYEDFTKRATIIGALAELLAEVREMVPGPIRVMSLSSDERIARDKKRKYDATCVFVANLVTGEQRHLRVGLRVGGRPRPVARELLPTQEPGTYMFEVNDGSRRRPKVKKYTLTIPENANWYAYIKRTA